MSSTQIIIHIQLTFPRHILGQSMHARAANEFSSINLPRIYCLLHVSA